MKRILFLLMINCLIISIYPNDITFEHLGLENGFSQITVFSLYQDENAGIWIGTNDGLMHYHGNSVENISSTKRELDMTSGFVGTICGDKNGHVFALINNRIIEYDLKLQRIQILNLPKYFINKHITTIYYGHDALWIGVSNIIYIFKNGQTTVYTALPSKNLTVTALCQTQDGRLIVGTLEKGVFIIDGAQKQYNFLPSCVNVNMIYEDSKRNLWICTSESGLYKIDNQLQIIAFTNAGAQKSRIISNIVRSVCEDNNGNMWIGTFSGLDKLNPATNEIQHFGQSVDRRHSLSSQSIRCLTKDTQGTIWIGTYYGGINYFNPEPDTYSLYDFKKNQSDFVYPIIGKIIEDKRGDFWICTEGKGLVCFNRSAKNYQYFSTDNSAISGNNIKSILYDSDKDIIWIGTYRNGLNMLDLKTRRFTHYYIGDSNSSIPNEFQQTVQAMVTYRDKLLLGTLFGVFSFDVKTGQATHMAFSETIRDMLVVGNELWIAKPDGLLKYNLQTGKTEKEFKQNIEAGNYLPKNRITKLFIDSKNRFWIATDGGGIVLLNRKTNSLSIYNSANCGLESNNVSCLAESKYGYILAGTSKGFSRIDVEQKKSINYSSKNGFSLSSLTFGSIFTCSTGELVIGGIDGMTIFREEALSNLGKPFNMQFTDLWINNRKVTSGDNTGILKVALPYTTELELRHDHRIISFEFATDNYIKTNQPNFQYKLEGFDKQWLTMDASNSINYMNLPSGSYTLKVRSQINADDKNQNNIELKIKILPPLYARWYAFILYIILLTGITAWIFRFYQSRLLLKTSLEFERRQKEHNEVVNQSKLKFFTNISHEFRTPLTLIMGQLEMLMQSSKIGPTIYNSIVNVHNNAMKMNLLISELLDFRKQEQGYKKLKVSEYDIVEYIREIFVSFQEFAKFRGIELTFSTNKEKIPLMFDYTELQKVFYNLISNTFKFTHKGGKIRVEIEANNDVVRISVSDTGVGISKENLNKIFDRFYQADNEDDSSLQNKGTGIGLALAKGIVELHNGRISVSSTQGVGSTFVVELQYGDLHFRNNDQVEITDSHENIVSAYKIQTVLDNNLLKEVSENQQKNFSSKPTILIVEDNENLRQMLVELFDTMYNVVEANNGKIGYQLAQSKHPDLILSDVMMPEMNGNDMCTKLKSNFETCHIPVVLLTAQTSLEQNLDGLKRGADDYITKPFNVNILVTRCSNLLMSRKVLQEKFSKQIDNSAFTIATNELDQEFIEKIISIVEAHISDEKLDVDLLCSEMAIGRRVFFYKMKSITGQTPNDFIQNIRLKKAAWILQNVPDKTISELSEELGYNSVSYFGKCFKAKFGVLPSEYKNSKLESDKITQK
jgi:signal transduction histidine kinase/ligand-binding sensor domain-containing protein/DNA-binding response OmpR family regulator